VFVTLCCVCFVLVCEQCRFWRNALWVTAVSLRLQNVMWQGGILPALHWIRLWVKSEESVWHWRKGDTFSQVILFSGWHRDHHKSRLYCYYFFGWCGTSSDIYLKIVPTVRSIFILKVRIKLVCIPTCFGGDYHHHHQGNITLWALYRLFVFIMHTQIQFALVIVYI
jgi:hypothetical protein